MTPKKKCKGNYVIQGLIVCCMLRMLSVAAWTLAEIHDLCKIDPWFFSKIEDLISTNNPWQLNVINLERRVSFFKLKRKGFFRFRIAKLLDHPEAEVVCAPKQNIALSINASIHAAADFHRITAYCIPL